MSENCSIVFQSLSELMSTEQGVLFAQIVTTTTTTSGTPPPSHPTLWAANPTVLKPPSKSNYHPLVHLSEASSCSSFYPLWSHTPTTNMNSLFLVIVALTQIGRTLGIVDNLDKKEVVLGIMSNICPLLGEFNTPLGAEGEILSVRWQKSGQKPRQNWRN